MAVARQYRMTQEEAFVPPVVGKIDPGQARAYAMATNDDNPVYASGTLVPPVFGVVPTWEAFTSTLETVVPPDSMPMVVHLEHDMFFHRPMAPGLTMLSEPEVVSTRVGAPGTQVTIRVVSFDPDGVLLLEQYGTLFVRGFRGPAIERGARPSHSFPPAARGHPVATVTLPVDDDQPYRYAEASGDMNRIHMDDEFARSLGFRGVLLHGLCTLAMCSQAVINTVAAADPARIARLAVRFSKPVFPGDDIEVTIFRAGDESDGSTTSGSAASHQVYAFEAVSQGERVIRDGLAEVKH